MILNDQTHACLQQYQRAEQCSHLQGTCRFEDALEDSDKDAVSILDFLRNTDIVSHVQAREHRCWLLSPYIIALFVLISSYNICTNTTIRSKPSIGLSIFLIGESKLSLRLS